MGHWLSCIVLHLAVTRTGARSCDEHYYQMQAIADRRRNMVLLSSLLCYPRHENVSGTLLISLKKENYSPLLRNVCESVSGAVFFYARLINSLYQRLLSESFFYPCLATSSVVGHCHLAGQERWSRCQQPSSYKAWHLFQTGSTRCLLSPCRVISSRKL